MEEGPGFGYTAPQNRSTATLAIGDNLKDLPMFTQACASVAMANAPEIVKQRATAMGPGNDEESVAWGLTKVVFEKDLP